MDIEKYTVEERNATLYMTNSKGSPLVVLNNYSNDGGPVMKALKEMVCPDLNLLCVGNLNWNHDMRGRALRFPRRILPAQEVRTITFNCLFQKSYQKRKNW